MTPTQRQAMEQMLAALENVHVTGPDLDGVLWINLPGKGTTGKAILRVGKEGLIAAQCAKFFESERVNAIIALRAALADTAEPVAGWKLVPVEPTPEMLEAGSRFLSDADSPYEDEVNAGCYFAMLNAAPQPPAPAVRDVTPQEDAVLRRAAMRSAKVVEAPAVELTDEDLVTLWGSRSDGPDNHEIISYARAAIAAHEAKRGKA